MRSFQRDIGRRSGPLNRRELSAWGADSLFRSWQWLSDVGCVIIRRRRTLREQTKINIEPPSINGFCPLSLSTCKIDDVSSNVINTLVTHKWSKNAVYFYLVDLAVQHECYGSMHI